MISKRFFFILIGIAVFGFGSYTFWNATRPQSSETQKVDKVTRISDATRETSKQPPRVPEETSKTQHRSFSAAERLEFVKSLFSVEQLAKPEAKRIFKLLESEEYQTFSATNPTLEERFNFLADRGADVPRNLNMKLFRESFPTGEPIDFEAEMRQKLSQMFINAGLTEVEETPAEILKHFETLSPEDIEYATAILDEYGDEEGRHRLQESDPAIAVLMRKQQEYEKAAEVLREFRADLRNLHWEMAFFQGQFGKNGSGSWVIDILTNISTPAAEPAFMETPEMSFPTQNEMSDEPVVPEVIAPQNNEESPRLEVPSASELEHAIQDNAKLEGDLIETFTPSELERSELLTKERFETTLRERFSPERFNRAMQTLNRYGPKEGLRRLKDEDPEVAKQVERLLQRQHEED